MLGAAAVADELAESTPFLDIEDADDQHPTFGQERATIFEPDFGDSGKFAQRSADRLGKRLIGFRVVAGRERLTAAAAGKSRR